MWLSWLISTCNVGDLGSILGLKRSPGEGKGTHSSILAWKIPWTVLGLTKSQTRLSDFYFHNPFNVWKLVVAAAAQPLQSCPTLCNPIDSSPPGSVVPGILQARTEEWVAISFSNAGKCKVKVKSLSRVQPSVTPWTAAIQPPLSMGFSRQEYWSGVPLPSPCHCPN